MSVAVETSPLAITIVDDTPVVTIVDNSDTITIQDTQSGDITIVAADGNITVIDNTLEATVTTNNPTTVIVSTGVGGGYDLTTVTNMLVGQINDTFLDATLLSDISNARDIWTRVGNEIILTNADETSITTAYQLYTDTQISNTVAALDISNGNIYATIANLNIEAAIIDAHVAKFIATDAATIVSDGRITVTESDIVLAVARLTSLDGPTGDVVQLTADIAVNTGNIAANVVSIAASDAGIVTQAANWALTDASLTTTISNLSTVTGDLLTAQTELTSTSAITQITATTVAGHDLTLSAIEYMFTDRWGVTITESAGGYSYVTGIGLILHPNWVVTTMYAIGDYVWAGISGVYSVYRCIQAHTASAANSPESDDPVWAFWVEDTGGEKTEFRVQADKFVVYTSDAAPDQAVFTATADAVTIGSGISLRSDGYDGIVTGYQLDAATKTATLVNMDLLMSGGGAIKGGQTAYATGTGYFLGYEGAAYKFSIGDTSNYMKWDGSTLEMKGGLQGGTVPDANAAPSGAEVGYHLDSAGKLVIGDANQYMYWDGSNFTLEGAKLQNAAVTRYIDLDASTTNPFIYLEDDSGNPVFYVNADGTGFIKRRFLSDPVTKSFFSTTHIPVYAAGTTFAENEYCYYVTTAQIWQSLQAGNIAHTPVEGVWWTDVSDTVGISGTNFTVPTDVTELRVTIIGGGGGGGAGDAGVNAQRSGGAGGASSNVLLSFTLSNVTPGATIAIIAGVGGEGGLTSGTPGLDGDTGGSSSFGTYFTVAGAAGGDGGRYNEATAPVGGVSVTVRDIQYSRSGGNGGHYASTPYNGTDGKDCMFHAGGVAPSAGGDDRPGGGGAASYFGSGGNGGLSTADGERPSLTAYGAGGGGGGSFNPGARGGTGAVIIEWD